MPTINQLVRKPRKSKVEKRKEDLLADLFSLLEINSERDDSKADAQHPCGQKFQELLHLHQTQNVLHNCRHFLLGSHHGLRFQGIFPRLLLAQVQMDAQHLPCCHHVLS